MSNDNFDRECIELAIAEARKSSLEDGRLHPVVGAVAAQQGALLATAFRGETAPGEHAEYVLLERKLDHTPLAGATIYTTAEPCTTRHHPRVPCTQRLIDRRIGKIFIGMLDPNPYLTGRSINLFRQAGIETVLFPPELATQVQDQNRAFLEAAGDSMPPPKVRISGYEWDLLQTEGTVAGRTRQMWYEHFLASNDLHNLGRLLSFYTPPPEQVSGPSTYDITPADTARISVATDLRLIESVTADPARLLSLSPRQFEHFTRELLERLGYCRVAVGQGSKDGGVDVSAYIEHPFGTERVIVQCKRNARDNKVGEPVIKQLLADADIHRAIRGLIVTTSYLTRGARLLIETYSHRLSALDYDELSRILRGEARRDR